MNKKELYAFYKKQDEIIFAKETSNIEAALAQHKKWEEWYKWCYVNETYGLEEKLRKWTEQQNGRKPILSEGQKEQIEEWKNAGVSNREIARRLEVSEGTVRNFLKGS